MPDDAREHVEANGANGANGVNGTRHAASTRLLSALARAEAERKKPPRSVTIKASVLFHRRPALFDRVPLTDDQRPQTRRECQEGGDKYMRPCPFVGCGYNTYLDVAATGTIKLNVPNQPPWSVAPEMSCALDVAARGGITLDDTGKAMRMTRERARQVEEKALRKLQKLGKRLGAY